MRAAVNPNRTSSDILIIFMIIGFRRGDFLRDCGVDLIWYFYPLSVDGGAARSYEAGACAMAFPGSFQQGLGRCLYRSGGSYYGKRKSKCCKKKF